MNRYVSSKVKVTRSRDVSAGKNAIIRQKLVLSTSNVAYGGETCLAVHFLGQ